MSKKTGPKRGTSEMKERKEFNSTGKGMMRRKKRNHYFAKSPGPLDFGPYETDDANDKQSSGGTS